MKRIFCQLLGCWMMVFFIAGAMAHPYLLRVSDTCLDSMETVPDGDELMPTETAVDDGCMLAPEGVISI